MKIDSVPVVDLTLNNNQNTIRIQSQNRELIQAVRAVNSAFNLGGNNELAFSLDRQTRRPVVNIVDRTTREVVEQIPSEQVLRLAKDLSFPE